MRLPRLAAVAAICVLLLFAAMPAARAEEETGLGELLRQETERLLGEMDLTSVQEAAPELDVAALLESAAQGAPDLSAEALLAAAGGILAGSLRSLAPRLLRIVGLAALSAGLLRLRASAGDGASRLLQLLTYLCMALPAAVDAAELLQTGRETTGRMVSLFQALLPTMLALLTSMGGAQSAVQMQSVGLLATGTLAGVAQRALFPLLGLAAALAVLSRLAPEIRLESTGKLLRSLVHWALGIGFTLFLGILTVQGATSASYDGVTMRAAKYAVDKLVPVIGGAFKDTADTLVGCSIVVKNAVGAVGLAGLLAILLGPCAQVGVTVAAYRLCAAAVEPLGAERIAPALHDFADILSTLFILMISIGAMFFVFVAALMRMGMGFV
ncbi:MAG: stage III sporulation protein AE [Candidatus Spyradocola sp.]|jgi:stage III sporulation protein AE